MAEVYVYLVSEMHSVINDVVLTGKDFEHNKVLKLTKTDSLLVYAREATELAAFSLADRYYLEVK